MRSERIKLSTSITFFYSLITFSIVFSSLFLMKTLVMKYTIINYSSTISHNYFHPLSSLVEGNMKGQVTRILNELTIIYGDKILSDPYGIGEKIKIPNTFPFVEEISQDPYIFVEVGEVNGKKIIAVAQAYQLKILQDTLNFFTLFISLAAALVVVGIGLFFSNRTLKPLKKISKELEKVRISRLDRELPKQKYEEFQQLVDTLNSMLKRLKMGFDRQEQFISDASHELRTPLAATLANLDMLLRWGKDDPKILDESLNEMKTSLKKLHVLVESLLELSRGNAKVYAEEVDLKELAKELAKETEFLHPEFKVEVEAKETEKVKTDREKLKEILSILLDNAVKYSNKSKKIIIHVKKASISVEDFGRGMEHKESEHIFDRFYRAEKSRSGTGFGLGLSIAKKIADILNAEIKVESQLGKGSKFTVYVKNTKN
jgi:two-component system sensor histidine kinase ArlS